MNNNINFFNIQNILKKLNSNYKVIGIETINEGRMSKIYKIYLQNIKYCKYILKIRSFENKNFKQGFAVENDVNPLLRKFKIFSSPKIYLSDTSRKEFNFDYSILEFVNGKTLNNFNNKTLFFNSGQLLAKIHSIKVNYLGKIMEDKFDKYNAKLYYNKYFSKVVNDLSYYDIHLANKVNRFINLNFNINYYKDLLPVLLHNDFHMKNIMVSQDEKINFIDWDCARYAHSEVDFIKFRHLTNCRDNIEMFINLIKGYKTIKELDLTPNFFIHEIIWFARMYTFEKNNISNNHEYFPNTEYYENKIIEYCDKKSINNLYKELCYEL
ncbi:aminoglycoside phosphotransferase family protein [Clostridium pasteurianum]|uniref:aminoglycoside phosphotransferase family protein n=1 Tax=Clostridium pasteurianum TaxID=1501 RepID=UPI002260B5AF|nr:aminoglycoside phosphotransferase family protein [Clostridium pasteurianum]UZW14833.1 aminoglycoside phosphotransferase family protein [Clostridium pasteurianum]